MAAWPQGVQRVQRGPPAERRRTPHWTWYGEGSPGGASRALTGTPSQGCIKGTLSAPRPRRPLLCLAALPPPCTTGVAPAPHTQPHCHQTQGLSRGPLAQSLNPPQALRLHLNPHLLPSHLTALESHSRISKEEFLRAQALGQEGQALPGLLVQLQGGHR